MIKRVAATSRRWLRTHWLPLAIGLAAASPALLSIVNAIRDGWMPLGDDGVIAVRSLDVFSTHSPLVGQYSNASNAIGGSAYSLGPLLYWLLAVPARAFGATGLAATMGLVNAGSLVCIVALAYRRGRWPLMIAAACAVDVMCSSFAGVVFREIWNPAAGLIPLTLLVFLAWSVACGEYRLLVPTVLVASFVAQAHLTYAGAAAGLLIVATAGLVLVRRTHRNREPAEHVAERRSVRRWSLAALVVGAVCWSAPALDEVVHRPGNLVTVAKTVSKHKPTLGPSAGWHAVVRAIGIPPWWLRGVHNGVQTVHDVRERPGELAIASSILILFAVGGTGAAAIRRRRFDIVAAVTISLVLCLALALVATATPTAEDLSVTVAYTVWWGSVVGMWIWLSLGWGLIALIAPTKLRQRVGRAKALRIGGIAAVCGLAALVTAQTRDKLRPAYKPARTIVDRVRGSLRDDRPVWVDSAGTWTALDFQSTLVFALRREGVPVVAPALDHALGPSYRPRRNRTYELVRIEDGAILPPKGARVIARVPMRPATWLLDLAAVGGPPARLVPHQGVLTVTLTRGYTAPTS
jgi:hypothetical protein